MPGDQLDVPDPRPWVHRRTGVPVPAHVERYAQPWAVVRDKFGSALSPEAVRLIERFGRAMGEWAEHLPGPYTLAHHDFRFDNLMFSPERVWVLDWQMAAWAPPAFDLVYLIGSSVEPEQRRGLEQGLVRRHVEDLTERGVEGLTEECGAGRSTGGWRRPSCS
ncbi:phosphotransferase [Amycolatopsis sp. NPDC004368]